MIQTKKFYLPWERIKDAFGSIETERDLHPPKETEKPNHIFAYHATLNLKDRTIYVYFTVKSPIRSLEGNAEILVLYDWSYNAILATPRKYLKDDSIVATFKENITYLTKWGFKPKFKHHRQYSAKDIEEITWRWEDTHTTGWTTQPLHQCCRKIHLDFQ